jgi:hypothetical protein
MDQAAIGVPKGQQAQATYFVYVTSEERLPAAMDRSFGGNF